ncbi:Alpha-ketoglutarate-dependent dioxygenase alkB 7 [Phytophthora citrophthora]|uniref:Alpha-ketoglutarate-dependent dioxygenase alkB 7 n=1 Tax=Phytophthora citrophthora TaxID=4793 RepID=A0AAD9LQB8_9STRA|nr:Alpha-ketoglutarate-dependent dioxygenase alkB 7 [Phytophthora citrophthora]
MSNVDSSSDEENDFFGRIESDDLFEETEVQQTKRREAARYVEQYAEREWGLTARQRRIQGGDKDFVTESALELRGGKKIIFQEKQGQQAKVWDCALVLSKFLANDEFFPNGFFENKRVIELGCGIGVPGLAAAALGAKEVTLTDMPMAVPWIQTNIDRNQTLGCISVPVRAQGLMWGEKDELEALQFDVILCSDLVYGHRDISQKLVETILHLSHPNTLIVSAHEARFAGDRGESFFKLLSDQQFQVEQVPRERLDAVYNAANMHMLSSRPLRRSLAPLRRLLSSSTVAASSPQSLWQDVYNLDSTHCQDPLVSEGDLQVMLDIITEDEEKVVADECSRILKRRRYEEDHWDNVIIKFKEMERSRWSTETQRILQKVREAAILPKELTYFPAVHVIELAEDGYIKPHVDSIKFSGRVVAGINLLSPSIMRFKEEHGDSIIDAYLQRRSMYMMTGRVRYHYTHEILPGAQVFKGEVPVNRTHRISIMLRDEFLEEHVAKYHTPFAKPGK